MKRFWAAIGLAFLGHAAYAQSHANAWIDYDPARTYLEVRIASDGLYSISDVALSDALDAVGVDIANVDPRSVQVFGRGEEQYIHVEGQDDGSFDTGDYLEFYAQGNDGWLDASFYPSPEKHTNPYYSLYNDTASYYITWDPSGAASAFRYAPVPLAAPSGQSLSYVWKEEVKIYNSAYQKGKDLGGGVPPGTYVGGKGWMSGNFGYNSGNTPSLAPFAFNTPHAFNQASAPTSTLEIAVGGVNNGAGGSEAHHLEVSTDNGNGFTVIDNLLYSSYAYLQESWSIAKNLIGSTTTVRLRTNTTISPLNTTSDYSACAYIKLTYPRTLAMDGASAIAFEVPANAAEVSFSATDFTTVSTGHLYDLGQHKRIEVNHNTTTGTVQCNIAPGVRRPFYLAASNAIQSLLADDLSQVVFSDPADIAVADAYVIISHGSLMAQAQSYASYRATDYNVVLLDIETLYDQFSYGVRKHPIAIRNFIDYAIAEWPSPPSSLFVLGKSIEEKTMRKNANHQRNTLVPAMGYPVSDVLLTAGLNGEKKHVPAVPTGRLAAREGQEITTYLSKIRDFEKSQNTLLNPYTLDNRQSQKHILHFAGGDDVGENNRFKSYLSGYQAHVEDSLFGGKVFLFSKTSGNVIEQLNTDSVRALIKSGPAIMTFFGHASGNSFDLSVDDPTLWENQGRYPVVIANSCFSGNIHLPVNAVASVSEQYVFTPNEGSIAFLATPDLSFETALNNYTQVFYRHLASTNYGASIGEQMKATCDDMLGDEQNASIAIEMTLHGDPALKIYPHDKPEITVNDPLHGADVRFKPRNITTDLDSFDVIVTLSNIGRSVTDPFSITVRRVLPNEQEIIETKELAGLNYEEDVIFRFATLPQVSAGENRLIIEVDQPLDLIPEYIESANNIISSLTFNVSSSDIFPVYPYNFGVVPDFDITLRANTGFPMLPEAEYQIQIDTTDRYSSSFMKSTQITQRGAVIEWTPGLNAEGFQDSTVFFWRVAPANDTSKWREFSFQVINDAVGWGQDHFFQYKSNPRDFLQYDRTQRQLDFTESSRDLFVQVIGNPSPLDYNNNFYSLDGQSAPLGEYGIASVNPGMAVVVIDSMDLKPWGTYGIGTSGNYENADKQFGNSNNGPAHRSRVEYFFTFSITNANHMNSMINMLQNEVEDGQYLLIYTQLRGLFNDTNHWSEAHLQYFESLGADSIRDAGDQLPYIFLVKKGYPNTSKEVIGSSANAVIKLSRKLFSNFRQGSMNAPVIGPAMDWSSAHFKSGSLDASVGDLNTATISKDDGSSSVLPYQTLTTAGSIDLDGIAIDSFPYLQMEFNTEDNSFLTAGQLRNWHILYDPAPDMAINPIKGQTLQANEQLNAGSNLHFGIAMENISDYSMGEFSVRYWYVNSDGELMEEMEVKYASAAAGEVIFDSVAFASQGLSGRYVFYMEVNPQGENWHREQYRFNNTAFLSVSIESDRKNPLLDVTFDGVHILNGDIVSPVPEIVMELKDENTVLLMDDTSSFDVFLTDPSSIERRIPFYANGQEIMFFEPATSAQNKARITYQPKIALKDGKYQLRVMGRDASGNESGDEAYTIEFEVINKSSVTHVVNYPNPFSTSTRFVFTLTGTSIPDVFTIQIMTVTGKVVREITKDELGPIHIGRNMSDYAWDGRDEFGDRLANGVYLYRVIMKVNGEEIDRRETAADQYFRKEFGKMYLFR
ncbi:MAG: C25 family cysteine peptidase [Cryomorphaceae bacterium]